MSHHIFLSIAPNFSKVSYQICHENHTRSLMFREVEAIQMFTSEREGRNVPKTELEGRSTFRSNRIIACCRQSFESGPVFHTQATSVWLVRTYIVLGTHKKLIFSSYMMIFFSIIQHL